MTRIASICLFVLTSMLMQFSATAQPIDAQRWETTSPSAAHPAGSACVAAGFKLVGGGAKVNWSGAGNLLTASYPESNCWVARAKDHQVSSPATLTVWAIGLRDAQDQWDVRIEHATGLRAAHPTATVGLPVGYALTGGGGLTNWAGSGNLLTASYPLSPTAWEVRAKDHEVSDPAEATAYIIGIRPRQGPVPQSNISSAVSGTDPHPSAMVAVAAGFMLVGGGARVNWTGAGNLLTASFPSGNDWIASSKDHDISDPADISVFAIGIR